MALRHPHAARVRSPLRFTDKTKVSFTMATKLATRAAAAADTVDTVDADGAIVPTVEDFRAATPAAQAGGAAAEAFSVIVLDRSTFRAAGMARSLDGAQVLPP